MRRSFAVAALAANACNFGTRVPAFEGSMEEVPVDAVGSTEMSVDGTIDGSTDPALVCPTGYVVVAGAPSTSMYRTTSSTSFASVHADCKDDQPGSTHLVTLDSVTESMAVRTFAGADAWVGAVQQPDAVSANVGWMNLTGGVVLPTLWNNGQPDDEGDGEDNEQNVAMRRANGISDEPAGVSHIAVCECDGVAIDPVIEGYIPSS